MNIWYLYTTVRGDQFAYRLESADKDEAIAEAKVMWEKLSRYDQEQYTEWAVVMPGYDIDSDYEQDAWAPDPQEYEDLLPELKSR